MKASEYINQAGKESELACLRKFNNNDYKVNPSAFQRLFAEVEAIKRLLDDNLFHPDLVKTKKKTK